MRFRIVGLVGLAAALAAVAVAPEVGAQPAASKLTWAYGHDVRVRKGGNPDFGPDTPKYGVEFYKDDSDTAANGIIAASQAGNLAVVPSVPVGADKKATWLFAHDLRARKGDVVKFENATKFGVEAYKDLATNKLLYVSETASIALADAPATIGTEKEPTWHHGLTVKVRKAKDAKFDDATQKFGVEVFKDGNTGGLIYICDTGAIATAPAPAQAPASDKVKAPTALHGLTLKVRKADEFEFGPNTKVYGVEVFRDENTGGLIYISETGSIATVPPSADAKTGLGVSWKHSLLLRARPGGVNEFAKANKYGVEAYLDKNTGYTIYISETGSIAVLPKK